MTSLEAPLFPFSPLPPFASAIRPLGPLVRGAEHCRQFERLQTTLRSLLAELLEEAIVPAHAGIQLNAIPVMKLAHQTRKTLGVDVLVVIIGLAAVA